MVSEFGTVLRRLRVREGMTQDELERRSGVSVSTIRGLETGKRSNPRMATVQQLADALALNPADRDELIRAAVPGTPGGGSPENPHTPDTDAPGPEALAAEGAAPEGSAAEEPDPTEPEPDPKSKPPSPDPLSDATGQLAKAVAARWQREEEQRQIQDPYPLPVRWQNAAPKLVDHWANIRRLPPGAANDALDLSGRLEHIADTYRDIPSGRLVVLGRSGSGKTILTLRFVLDHLKTRTPDEPVPVIFSVGAWNPTTVTLRDWLTEQLMRDHPGTAASARGPGRASLAAALVDSGRVLPVLDGFDEIAERLRRPALEALNATILPLLLTSRPGEYAAAVAETDVLTAAAAIELTDLTLDDLDAYLPRTTRKTNRANPDEGAWDPVLRELRKQPAEPPADGLEDGPADRAADGSERAAAAVDGPASPLATVLTTPLMVSLARTIYSDTPDRDPADLLKPELFGTPQELEDHLLDNFIPTVYRHRPQDPPRDCDPDRARRWLGYLAHHLTRQKTPDLAWWRFGNGLRGSTRTLVTALVTGLAIGLVDGAVSATIRREFIGPLVDAAVVGPLAGLMFGLVHWLTYTAKGKHVTPSAVRLQIRGRPENTSWKAGPRLVIGTLGGAMFGFAYGFVVGLVKSYGWRVDTSAMLHIAFGDGLIYGLVFGAGTGLAFCLLGLLETPLDLESAVNPRTLLTTDRRTVTTQLLVWAPTFGASVGVGIGVAVDLLQGPLGPLEWTPEAGLLLGLISGLGAALGYALTLTAWGQWLVLARIWLPLTGRLPWALVTFLDDAYQRGVLRQAGAVYQFRHARLQHHLAQHHLAQQQLSRHHLARSRRRSALHDDFIVPP
ncbi:XRE family transcriptional regulator [Streptomyces sp. HD]|uniref:XRE family transcriptional regulator n=1 Tax=Streptomyces sp. HD TaxID=3020892 RepID=UPI00232FCAB0|nr:XRE family transcriptional regulator [Streptomyces sp. HD]MDC0769256.1 helix-turn-helix domain-containing protein [Streptomyces sp. HD]